MRCLDLQIDWNAEMVPLIIVNESPAGVGNVETAFEADFAMEKAIKRPLSPETIIKQLKKTGGTPFIIQNISLNYPGDLFTPLGNLNHLKRQILGKIQDKILDNYLPPSEEIEKAIDHLVELKKDLSLKDGSTAAESDLTRVDLTNIKPPQPVKIAIYVDCIPSLEAALQAGCKRIYFQPKIDIKGNKKFQGPLHCLKNRQDYDSYFKMLNLYLMESKKLCDEYNANLIWKWPEITNNMFIEGATDLLSILTEKSISGVMVDGTGALWALKKISGSISLHGSGGLNIWNHMTVDELCSKDELSKNKTSKYKNSEFKTGLKSITLSPEISQKELRNVVSHIKDNNTDIQLEFLVQGNLEALVSEDCLIWEFKDKNVIKNFKNSPYHFLGIKDFKNRIFPVEIDAECRTHISNSVELCLIDHIPHLSEMGFDRLVIDSRNKPADYAHTMVSLYQKALELSTKRDPKRKTKLNSLKKQVKKISNGGITTGNFLRGVHDD